MASVVYKLENNCLLVVPENVKVAFVNPTNAEVSADPLATREYAKNLRTLANALDDIDGQLGSKLVAPSKDDLKRLK